MRMNKRVIGIISTFFALLLTATSVAASNDLDGVWRGELEIQNGVSLALGVTIKNGELTLDSPNQGMFHKVPTTFSVTNSQVHFEDTDLSASFQAELEDGVLVGTFTQGKVRPLVLHKLDEQDLARQAAFEGAYEGDLIINRRNSLPLRVNIAVLKGSYLATLDSPAQEAYSIPISDIRVSESALSFQSPMINASYSGEASDAEGVTYEGRFIQGQTRTLNLKKVTEGEARTASPKPKLGDNGGAAAIITPAGVETRYFSGHNAQTQYEIGSVTKTFVAYLLAQHVAAGKLALDDEASEIWAAVPAGISLLSLATHYSGLPRLPEGLLAQADPNDPYAAYDARALAQSLAQHTGEPGEYEYSNYGFGLLGELMAQVHDMSFSDAVQQKLFTPFAMNNSYVALTGGPDTVTTGYNILAEPQLPWHFQSLAGAGGIVSTLDDMVVYTQSLMQLYQQEDPAVQLMLTPVYSLGAKTEQALGWILSEDNEGKKFAWHNGQTAGFTSFVGFYLDGSRAVIALNSQSVGINETAMSLLTDPSASLSTPAE
ncbi:hypothetical protein CWE15_10530 [Aliidiomarina taiwanensis]|uniref:Beta-lactamase-related domain-containing protein n=1 Tax=Aliidiomarina taiwanensis TaxID=946228 RepID=A0A432WYU1_9GAMM|nr:serine hydrolase domain-containing protein [Aliidiomarina taiwanensis]RUO38929.1 hypothetical protein CWE15_10530 [Aliidiomarina taiwanensis]